MKFCRVLEDNYLTILDEYRKFNFQDDVNIFQRMFYDENYKFWKFGHEASLAMAKMKDDGVDYDTANFGVYKNPIVGMVCTLMIQVSGNLCYLVLKYLMMYMLHFIKE